MNSTAKLPHSPLLYSYLKKYQEDPHSRVFAPLAEAYRKAGLIDEAISIAREGLVVHPDFLGGRVALARALFDKKNFAEVVSQLVTIIKDIPDNLVAQKLFADSCLMLGNSAEALNSYKVLLYFNPMDSETAQLVQELEAQAYAGGQLVLRTDQPLAEASDFEVRSAAGALRDAPENVQHDRKVKWVRKIERLQNLLQNIERYRSQ